MAPSAQWGPPPARAAGDAPYPGIFKIPLKPCLGDYDFSQSALADAPPYRRLTQLA